MSGAVSSSDKVKNVKNEKSKTKVEETNDVKDVGSKKERNNLNVIVVGHVDSGKSTTTGHLIYKLGGIDKRVIEKFEKESQEMGKGSFKYAWVLDNLKAERERGITIDITLRQFKTERYSVTVIDAPGHKDFIKNMITGATQADCAILVVSAGTGEFEVGISNDGQTREHLLLCNTLGVESLIVVVNKLDHDGWATAKERFMEIKKEILSYAKKAGYRNPDAIAVIPISGWHGDNMCTKSENTPWYNGFELKFAGSDKVVRGHTLVDAINATPIPPRLDGLPLRLPIQAVYKVGGVGTIPSGRVETGVLKKNMVVFFAPGDHVTEVKSIEMHHVEIPEGYPGDNVGFNVKGLSIKEIKRGSVASDYQRSPATVVLEWKSRLIVINHPGEIRPGYTPVVDCHTTHVSCVIKDIFVAYDKRSGKALPGKPEFLKNGSAADVLMKPTMDIVVEEFKEFPPLGRFAVRDMRRTVAVGVILEILNRKELASSKKK